MADLPTGTVTFLFTDIEGSTQLAQAHPESWESTRQRHDDILRYSCAAHQGHIFKIVGDAFCVAFATAPHAVAAALTAQRSLQSEAWGDMPIRVRMGLHTGAAEWQGGDYRGYLILALAQRIMAAAHGGQVLLSQTTTPLVSDSLPIGVVLRDMGEHRLKGTRHPEHLWQLDSPDLFREFPPLSTLGSALTNLPWQLTSFVGRKTAIDNITQLFVDHRLITLTGSGGCGKARLAIQVASELLDLYSDGVWLVELAALTDPTLIPQKVATVLSVVEQPGRSLTDSVVDHLHERRTLLLLDNCEHLLEASAHLVTTLITGCGRLCILATSRESLRITGEFTYRVPSLDTPDPAHMSTPSIFTQTEAVRLFVERAGAVQAGFSVTERNATTIASICHELDGLPLAIELAAACLRALPLEQIAAHLDERFRLLKGGSRSALPRHQTLRALIDWSYDLLPAQEQMLLQRLSVFAPQWTMDAAEHVGSGDNIASEDILDLLTNLVDESLVSLDSRSGRYYCLETVRQYALARLGETGLTGAFRTRHLDFYLEWLQALRAELGEFEQNMSRWCQQIDTEFENLLLAHRWCDDTIAGANKGLRLMQSLRGYWQARGLLNLGLRMNSEALERLGIETPSKEHATVLYSAGVLAYLIGRGADASKLLDRSVQIAMEMGDKELVAQAFSWLGGAAQAQGDAEAALRYCEEALLVARETADTRVIAGALNDLAEFYRAEGQLRSAIPLYEEGLTLSRERGDQYQSALFLINLSGSLAHVGSPERTRKMLLETLVLVGEIGSKRLDQATLEATGGFAATIDAWGPAARMFGASEAEKERMGYQRELADEKSIASHLARIVEATDKPTYVTAYATGRAQSLDEALTEAREWLEHLSLATPGRAE